MEIRFDYKLIEDSDGFYHLFVRDLLDEKSTLYYFTCHSKPDIVGILSKLMVFTNDVNLCGVVLDFGSCDNPEAVLSEMEETVANRNGRAWLVANGNIFKEAE